ncbi:MAG TPA: FkbM family methyltransferase [Caulobacteraceae bacterium]
MGLNVERLTKRAVLENIKRIGFRPGAVIDCGFAYGTEGLDVFEEAIYALIDPVQEVETAMRRFCETHPGSIYGVVAVGDEEGTMDMVTRKGVTGSSFHTKFLKHIDEIRRVPVVTLDGFLAAHDLPKPYLLKLDVEGHELHALRGAERTLRDTEIVIMEIGTWAEDHRRGRPSMMDLFRYMEDHGFVFYELVDPGFRPIDGALYMFDAVFAKIDSIVRRERRHKTPDQAAQSRQVKEQNAEAALSSLTAHASDLA